MGEQTTLPSITLKSGSAGDEQPFGIVVYGSKQSVRNNAVYTSSRDDKAKEESIKP